MKCTIHPGPVSGTIRAPASKSYAQRAIFAAALAEGTSELTNFRFSDDAIHALHNALNLGAEVRYFGDSLVIRGNPRPRTPHFYAGESGLCARILSALLPVFEGEKTLTGSGSLMERPFDPIFPVYDQLGVSYQSHGPKLPLTMGSITKTGDITSDGALSSQFITGLLMALPLTNFPHKLIIGQLNSSRYVDMTLELLKAFGVKWEKSDTGVVRLTENHTYRPARYAIEGDWSGAAFPIVAGIIAGQLQIQHLNVDSLQADQALLKLVENHIRVNPDEIRINEGRMEAFSFDATDCPDLFPPLAVLAANASGPSRIRGTHRLTHKESDRGKILQEEFGKLWVRIDLEDNDMIVYPSKPTGGLVDAHNDHRIAMALSILALSAEEPVTIEGVECVSKSYPQFFEDLRSLGVRLELG
jgi:3-phosphoshikimate 1-carboxyvinyltransferase